MEKDVIVYPYRNALYINLTNRCTNTCDFCIRKKMDGVGEKNLWLKADPTAAEVISELGEMEGYDEVVFCGYGEPLLRLDEVLEIAAYIKAKGKRTRVNTNGQAGLYHKKDIPPLLKGLIDTAYVSLNAPDKERYNELCHSVYGKEAYSKIIEFAKGCVAAGIKTVLSVVDIISKEEIEEAEKIAKSIGAELKIRKYAGG